MQATISQVMTPNPISVPADAGYKQLAGVLARYGISAVPVVDSSGAPIGVVSEADLLTRLDHRRRHWPAGPRDRERSRKAAGLLARDLMSTPVRTISTDESVGAAAVRLADAGIRRLFVVDDGKLVGVVSRRDLLSTFRRPDREIREVIERDILADTLWVQPGQASVIVANGIVTLLGRLDNRGAVERAAVLAAEVPGVLEVKNGLDFVWDDRSIRPAALGI